MTGFNSKRMMAMGRQTGKSVWGQIVDELANPNITKLTSQQVDGKTWYTVQLNMPVAQWLTEQPKSEWYEHKQTGWRRSFDVSEQMYSALQLKWS